MSLDWDARELIAQTDAEVVALARLVSLAVRIEAPLLRRARLTFLPHSDAGLESDLWWSLLIDSRSVDAIVLNSEVLAVLRQELVQHQLLDEARNLMLDVHHGESPATRLEEEVIWLGLKGSPEAPAAIEAALGRALRAMLEDPTRAIDLARWADRAIPGLPPLALATEGAGLLAVAAAARVGVTSRLGTHSRTPRLSAQAGWVLPTVAGVSLLGVRLQTGRLVFPVSDSDAGAILLLKGQLPVIAELAWDESDGPTNRIINLDRGLSVELPPTVTGLTLRTVHGQRFGLSLVAATAVEERGFRVAKVVLAGSPRDSLVTVLDRFFPQADQFHTDNARVRIIDTPGAREDSSEAQYLAVWGPADEAVWPVELDLQDADAVILVVSSGDVSAQVGGWVESVRSRNSRLSVLLLDLPKPEDADRESGFQIELGRVASELHLSRLSTESSEDLRRDISRYLNWSDAAGARSVHYYRTHEALLPGTSQYPRPITRLGDLASAHQRLQGGRVASAEEAKAVALSILGVAEAIGRVRNLRDQYDPLVMSYDSFASEVLTLLRMAQRGRDGLPIGTAPEPDSPDSELESYAVLALGELVQSKIAFTEGGEFIVPSLYSGSSHSGERDEYNALAIGFRWLGEVMEPCLGLLSRLSRERQARIRTLWPDAAVFDFMSESFCLRFSQEGKSAQFEFRVKPGLAARVRGRLGQRLTHETLSSVPSGTTVTTFGVETESLVYLSAAREDAGEELDRFTDLLKRQIEKELGRSVRVARTAARPVDRDRSPTADEDLFRADAFVMILSDAYLKSDHCGREFAAFRARVRSEKNRIIPIHWRGQVQFPQAVGSVLWANPATRKIEPMAEALKRGDPYVPEFVSIVAAGVVSALLSPLEPESGHRPLNEYPNALADIDPASRPNLGDWIVEIIGAMALSFHVGNVGRLDTETVLSEEERYGLETQLDRNDFQHVRRQCESLFEIWVSPYLHSGQDPLEGSEARALEGLTGGIAEAREGSVLSSYMFERAWTQVAGFVSRAEHETLARRLGFPPEKVAEQLQDPDRRAGTLDRLSDPEVLEIAAKYRTPFHQMFQEFPCSLQPCRNFPEYVDRFVGLWHDFARKALERSGHPIVKETFPVSPQALDAFELGFPAVRIEDKRPVRSAFGEETSSKLIFDLSASDYLTTVQGLRDLLVPWMKQEGRTRGIAPA